MSSRRRGGKTSVASATESASPGPGDSDMFDVALLSMEDTSAAASTLKSVLPTRKSSSRRSKGSSTPGTATVAPSNEEVASLLGDGLLEAVLHGGDMRKPVGLFCNAYRGGEEITALCGVLNLLVKASGVAEVEIDSTALTDGMDIAPLLEELYLRVSEDSAAYMLVNKDTTYHPFRRSFGEFFEQLVVLSYSADILLDGKLLAILTQWAVAMSESKARPFRHTATYALLHIVSGLCELLKDMDHQLVVVRSKRDVAALKSKRDDVSGWVEHIFSQTIHQRLRDVGMEVRLDTIRKLREWLLQYPAQFMSNRFLRYFGIPLHDKHAELRIEALDMILQTLARVPDAYEKMHLFLQYFTVRLVEMCRDTDMHCAERAIRVIAMMVRGDSEQPEGRELISNEMIDCVLLSLFDERPTIRSAAGLLLKVFIHNRTAAEEEAAQVKVAVELLFSFAKTLRTEYGEAMPEKYLVHALWVAERPPLMLMEYAHLLEFTASGTTLDTVVVLGLMTALLRRLRNSLSLGPLPKDDRHHATKRLTASKQGAVNELVEKLNRDLLGALLDAMERHRGEEAILRAAADAFASVDLPSLSAHAQVAQVSAVMAELRKASYSMPMTQATRDALTDAWYAAAFTEHPLRSEAHAHLQGLLDLLMKQLASRNTASTTSRNATPAKQEELWGRVHLLSSLVDSSNYWDLIKTSLMELLNAPGSSPELLRLAAASATRCVFWQVSAQVGGDPSVPQDALAAKAAELVGLLFRVLQLQHAGKVGEEFSSPALSWMHLYTNVLCSLFDVGALKCYVMPPSEQETLVAHFGRVVEVLSTQLSAAKAAVNEAAADQKSGHVPGAVSLARRNCSQVEASQVRLVTGIARLFILRYLEESLAPQVLLHWTRTPSKAVANLFKNLLHVLRERQGGSFLLEWSTLVAAYHSCAAAGLTPASVEVLSQTGSKLASLHFSATTDRYYSACVAVVEHGIHFAEMTDPLFLQAVVPYCAKLRVADALLLLQHNLATKPFFEGATIPYVRAFIAAMRRAAKLDAGSGGSGSITTVAVKRPRDIEQTDQRAEDELLEAIADSAPQSKRRDSRGKGLGGWQHSDTTAARVVTHDGWHVPVDDGTPSLTPVSVAMTPSASQTVQEGAAHHRRTPHNARSVVRMPSVEEIVTASIVDPLNGDEVFIATQDFE